MVTTNYCSLDSGPSHDVSSPMGGKQKPASGRMKVFRKLSIRSDSSSAPSSTISDEFRDEISSLDDKNTNRVDDFHLSPEIKFNPFESIPSWGFESPEKYAHGKSQALESPEEFEAFHKSPSASKTKKATTQDYSSDSNRPIILVRPGALKLDQWSKVLVRKKNQFKYHSFTNEKRVRIKKSSKAKAAMQAVVEERIALEELDYCRPEHFPSLNEAHIFHPDVGDEIKCTEGTSIGPLKPNTKLKLAVQESPKESIPVPELTERDQPHPDNFVLPEITEMNRPHPDNFVLPETTERDQPSSEKFVLEFVSAEEEKVAPSKVVDKVVIALDKKRNQKLNNGSKINEKSAETDETEAVYETSDYPSDGSFSTVISGDTENYPLLKAWGADFVDCNNCGSSKAQKKLEAKKKKAEAKKKMIEDLWERKQFYWKYENVEDQRRQHLENLETLVFKIAPEDENVQEDGFIEMPLGIQLSTITEGDEDLTACCSPRHSARSMGRSVSMGGKVTLNTPVDSILDMTNQEVAASPSEDEVEGYPQQPQNPNNETPKGKPEQPKMSRKARRRVVSVNEIVVRTSFDDGSTSDSKGGISDITEDYLHIPFSSPLYSKVLKAFREAAEENDGNDLKEEMNYLHWI